MNTPQGTVLVRARPGERAVAGEEPAHRALRDRIAERPLGEALAELLQEAGTGTEAHTMGLPPHDISIDRLAQDHARPSGSMAATSRRASSRNLA